MLNFVVQYSERISLKQYVLISVIFHKRYNRPYTKELF